MTLIHIQHLTQKHKDAVVLCDINLKIEKNTIFGILSDNNLSSTALMDVLAGIILPCEGTVTLGDYDVITNAKKAKSIVGYMPKGMQFYGEMTIIEYLTFIADAKGLAYIDAQKGVKKALDVTELLHAKDVIISKLNQIGRASCRERVSLCV